MYIRTYTALLCTTVPVYIYIQNVVIFVCHICIWMLWGVWEWVECSRKQVDEVKRLTTEVEELKRQDQHFRQKEAELAKKERVSQTVVTIHLVHVELAHIWITSDRNEVWAWDLCHSTTLVEVAKNFVPLNVKGRDKVLYLLLKSMVHGMQCRAPVYSTVY